MADTIIPRLERLKACGEAKDWASSFIPAEPKVVYDACLRGDWLLWLVARLGVDRKKLAMAAIACVRHALRYVHGGDTEALRSIEAAEAFVRGEVGADEITVGGRGLARFVSLAAEAAACSAFADISAANAGSSASDAVTFAADVVAYHAAETRAAADLARAAALKDFADLVRAEIPFETIEPLLPA